MSESAAKNKVEARHVAPATPKRHAWPLSLLIALLLTSHFALAQSAKYGIGRAPTAEEVKVWDISAFPDGKGLPEGSGTAAQGKAVYERRCAECHGNEGEGGEQAALVGGQGSLKTPKPLKTVGSYWPHATTLWDYTNRSMPFDTPGILTNDQVYAVVAHVLFLNGIIGENEEMNAETLPKVEMPNRGGFISDERPDVGKPATGKPR
jgi:cytochrome c